MGSAQLQYFEMFRVKRVRHSLVHFLSMGEPCDYRVCNKFLSCAEFLQRHYSLNLIKKEEAIWHSLVVGRIFSSALSGSEPEGVENCIFRPSCACNKIAEASELISFVLGGHLQPKWFADVIPVTFWLHEATWSGKGRGMASKVLQELAQHRQASTGPNHYLLSGTALCIVGCFAAPWLLLTSEEHYPAVTTKLPPATAQGHLGDKIAPDQGPLH